MEVGQVMPPHIELHGSVLGVSQIFKLEIPNHLGCLVFMFPSSRRVILTDFEHVMLYFSHSKLDHILQPLRIVEEEVVGFH